MGARGTRIISVAFCKRIKFRSGREENDDDIKILCLIVSNALFVSYLVPCHYFAQRPFSTLVFSPLISRRSLSLQ